MKLYSKLLIDLPLRLQVKTLLLHTKRLKDSSV